MGTKGKKPLSVVEKRQQRMMKEEAKKKIVKEEKKEVRITFIDQSLITKISNEISNFDVITPFTLSQRYAIKYSTAKKILKELQQRNLIDIISRNRRIIIAIPKKS